MRADERSEQRFESLDFVYDEAQRLVGIQLRVIDSLDTKTGILLGAAWLVLSVLVTGLGEPAIQGKLDRVQSFLLLVGGAMIIITVILATIALWIGHYRVAPDPLTMRRDYLTKPEADTKLVVLDTIVDCFEQNQRLIASKARVLRMGSYPSALRSLL